MVVMMMIVFACFAKVIQSVLECNDKLSVMGLCVAHIQQRRRDDMGQKGGVWRRPSSAAFASQRSETQNHHD